MKTFLKFLVFGSSVLFLASCQDVVQVKLDEGSKLYVIDAFVNNLRSKQTVRVLTNDSYFSNKEAPPVPGASVVLKDLTDNKAYNFTYAGNGNYEYVITDPDTIAKINHQYQLNVTIDGVTYTSLATQKRTASIDSISAEYNDGDSGGFGPNQLPFYLCNLWAKDKVDNNTDYYWIKTYRNDTLFSASGDLNICIDGTGGPVTSAELDSVYFTPPATFLGFKRYHTGNTCRAEVHSISRETYFFFVQASAQINNGGLFATTPENVKTNIVTPSEAKTKGIGWFNMATVASEKIVIP
jgi:hypothetical protein